MGLIPQWTLWAQKDNKAKKKKPCKTDFTQKWTITNMKLSLEPYFSKFMLNLLSVQPDLVLEMRNMLLDYIFLFQIYLVGIWSSKDLKRFSVDLVVCSTRVSVEKPSLHPHVNHYLENLAILMLL